MIPRFHHGQSRKDGFKFWGYAEGREYWITPSHFADLTRRLLQRKKQKYWENPEKARADVKKYRANRSQAAIEKTRTYDRLRNRKPARRIQIRAWTKQYKLRNPSFALSCRLRVRIANALARHAAGAKKAAPLEKLLGCPWGAFMQHLEKQFAPGMSWKNRHLWHVDHIKPCCTFDLTSKDEQLRCFNYRNLRPLWASENIRKSGKH